MLSIGLTRLVLACLFSFFTDLEQLELLTQIPAAPNDKNVIICMRDRHLSDLNI